MKSCFSFFLFFFADFVGQLTLFLGNKRNKQLTVGRSWKWHQKGERLVCSLFSLHCVVTESRLGWLGLSLYLCRHVFSIRQGCVTPDVSQLTWVRLWTVHKQEKTRGYTQTFPMLKYFWSLVRLGLQYVRNNLHLCVLASSCISLPRATLARMSNVPDGSTSSSC